MKRATGSPAPEERGALFEGMVAQLIRAYRDYREICDDFFYWAPSGRSAMEVDFILVRGRNKIAVEAKSGNAFVDGWCKGLRAVEGLEGISRRIVVYPNGPLMKTKDGIEVLPFDHFSKELAAGRLWKKETHDHLNP
jgi:predicted AAA+ superfamily ATPase